MPPRFAGTCVLLFAGSSWWVWGQLLGSCDVLPAAWYAWLTHQHVQPAHAVEETRKQLLWCWCTHAAASSQVARSNSSNCCPGPRPLCLPAENNKKTLESCWLLCYADRWRSCCCWSRRWRKTTCKRTVLVHLPCCLLHSTDCASLGNSPESATASSVLMNHGQGIRRDRVTITR